ncbi:MAG: hypothetical protein V1495_04740 [Pseudomonadota bacterium]
MKRTVISLMGLIISSSAFAAQDVKLNCFIKERGTSDWNIVAKQKSPIVLKDDKGEAKIELKFDLGNDEVIKVSGNSSVTIFKSDFGNGRVNESSVVSVSQNVTVGSRNVRLSDLGRVGNLEDLTGGQDKEGNVTITDSSTTFTLTDLNATFVTYCGVTAKP